MTRFANRIAFVIPTKDRPADLRRMLKSVEAQSLLPAQMVVVDGSVEPVETVVREFPRLPIDYVRVFPPSLARQRNAGMKRLQEDITLAGYLDDDLVLNEGALEAMCSFWEVATSDVGGAAFNIVNDRRPYATWLKAIFLMDSRRRGVVLPSGYHTMICPVDASIYVDWLFGGATVWRRGIIGEFSYDEWFQGTGFLEDVDYSYRVSRRYRLAVVADARVKHFSPPIRRDRNFLLGKWQVINRFYFVRKHPELSVVLCLWALLGQLLVNAGKGAVGGEPGVFERVLGNLVGIGSVMSGRLERTDGLLK